MYLHVGQEIVLSTRDILGIFDLDGASLSKATREYLNTAEKEGRVITVTYELPKSFIVTLDKKVYLSQISAATLKKRSGFIGEEENITYVKDFL